MPSVLQFTNESMDATGILKNPLEGQHNGATGQIEQIDSVINRCDPSVPNTPDLVYDPSTPALCSPDIIKSPEPTMDTRVGDVQLSSNSRMLSRLGERMEVFKKRGRRLSSGSDSHLDGELPCAINESFDDERNSEGSMTPNRNKSGSAPISFPVSISKDDLSTLCSQTDYFNGFVHARHGTPTTTNSDTLSLYEHALNLTMQGHQLGEVGGVSNQSTLDRSTLSRPLGERRRTLSTNGSSVPSEWSLHSKLKRMNSSRSMRSIGPISLFSYSTLDRKNDGNVIFEHDITDSVVQHSDVEKCGDLPVQNVEPSAISNHIESTTISEDHHLPSTATQLQLLTQEFNLPKHIKQELEIWRRSSAISLSQTRSWSDNGRARSNPAAPPRSDSLLTLGTDMQIRRSPSSDLRAEIPADDVKDAERTSTPYLTVTDSELESPRQVLDDSLATFKAGNSPSSEHLVQSPIVEAIPEDRIDHAPSAQSTWSRDHSRSPIADNSATIDRRPWSPSKRHRETPSWSSSSSKQDAHEPSNVQTDNNTAKVAASAFEVRHGRGLKQLIRKVSTRVRQIFPQNATNPHDPTSSLSLAESNDTPTSPLAQFGIPLYGAEVGSTDMLSSTSTLGQRRWLEVSSPGADEDAQFWPKSSVVSSQSVGQLKRNASLSKFRMHLHPERCGTPDFSELSEDGSNLATVNGRSARKKPSISNLLGIYRPSNDFSLSESEDDAVSNIRRARAMTDPVRGNILLARESLASPTAEQLMNHDLIGDDVYRSVSSPTTTVTTLISGVEVDIRQKTRARLDPNKSRSSLISKVTSYLDKRLKPTDDGIDAPKKCESGWTSSAVGLGWSHDEHFLAGTSSASRPSTPLTRANSRNGKIVGRASSDGLAIDSISVLFPSTARTVSTAVTAAETGRVTPPPTPFTTWNKTWKKYGKLHKRTQSNASSVAGDDAGVFRGGKITKEELKALSLDWDDEDSGESEDDLAPIDEVRLDQSGAQPSDTNSTDFRSQHSRRRSVAAVVVAANLVEGHLEQAVRRRPQYPSREGYEGLRRTLLAIESDVAATLENTLATLAEQQSIHSLDETISSEDADDEAGDEYAGRYSPIVDSQKSDPFRAENSEVSQTDPFGVPEHSIPTELKDPETCSNADCQISLFADSLPRPRASLYRGEPFGENASRPLTILRDFDYIASADNFFDQRAVDQHAEDVNVTPTRVRLSSETARPEPELRRRRSSTTRRSIRTVRRHGSNATHRRQKSSRGGMILASHPQVQPVVQKWLLESLTSDFREIYNDVVVKGLDFDAFITKYGPRVEQENGEEEWTREKRDSSMAVVNGL
ncbi:hypothetical protein BJ742DRAFT_815108 [Cladochytrium replicatum]|nr:hypothetical protein BJ742DRAFT_815108 [Cladochytrium replicatum]